VEHQKQPIYCRNTGPDQWSFYQPLCESQGFYLGTYSYRKAVQVYSPQYYQWINQDGQHMSKWHGGKGSAPRRGADQAAYENNWDRIFGKGKGKDPEQKTPAHAQKPGQPDPTPGT
jgi:hypothetical protein